jgi:hypothetical protein
LLLDRFGSRSIVLGALLASAATTAATPSPRALVVVSGLAGVDL